MLTNGRTAASAFAEHVLEKRSCEAKRLMLTHMVPAPPAEQYDAWAALAAEHFDGEIILGDDLTTVSI